MNKKIFNFANLITFFRVPFTIAAMIAIINKNTLFAILFFALAILTDAMDGFVARKLKISSKRGDLIDSLADFFMFYAIFFLFLDKMYFINKIFYFISGIFIILTIGGLSFKKRAFSIPHRFSSRLLGYLLAFNLFLFILGSEFADFLMIIIAVIAILYVIPDYLIIGIKKKS
jgi:CDP-diacylglycerol--glycerol-3-phosphate 3-phosphatidyltransferase